ncbi:hypothetical protein Salat_1419400 [Sesamum alatum]|uniref:Uncharacterized protein n=1 Tax=Sesamum alatum TaxID=300844 RepID=A0AAE1YBC3_9LAMI|nr:hypothetical protein Salat_1419400 [Sesamum alatum]
MLERTSKNRYLDEDHSKQILSGVTVEDVEWRPYEKLQQKQSQMLSLEPQRIFFTASVLFYYQLINYDMPELAPRQLGIHRSFTLPKRCTKKVKAKDPNSPSGASNDGSDTPHDGPYLQDDGPNAPSEDAPLDDHPNNIVDPSSTGLNDTLDFDGLDVQNDEPYTPPEMRPSMIIPMSLSIILILIVHTIQKIILVLAVLDHMIILTILHQLCEDKKGKDIRLRVEALIRRNNIGAAYRLYPFPSLCATTLIGWNKILERPSKNRYLDEDHSKQFLSGVTVEDVEWRPYERLQQKQSQMLSLEPQRIFFTASVLFTFN